MKPKKENIWLILFWVAAAMNLLAHPLQSNSLIYISKPLLMIFLALHFLVNGGNRTTYGKLILLGLIFSFFGDVFLMIRAGEKSALFFLLGLGSFLITQFCYFFAFYKYPKVRGFVKKNLWILLLFLAFLLGNSAFLLPDLPDNFKIPVIVYSTVITLMVVSCLNLYQEIPNDSFKYLIAGVLLFLCSDTLIGLSQFKAETLKIPFSGLLIMATYILAQFLIVKGSIELSQRTDYDFNH